jgi:hypothetical protein
MLRALTEPFAWLTGMSGGSSYALARWVFLRALGAIYLVAFLSLAVQVRGLVGERGILPAGRYLAAIEARVGPERYWRLPTVFWLGAGDRALLAACLAGAAGAALVLAGIAPAPLLLLLWALYLSLCGVGRDFLAFQWDVLLLEAGLLAVFFAPWSVSPRLAHHGAVNPVALALLWWLLFRLMFESGVVKLSSGDPAWRDLTALQYHYFTQPLPNPLSWFAHQLPAWFHRLSTAGMYAAEIALPLAVCGPRPLRLLAAAGMALFQLLIFSTGNYNFFNLLTIALCFTLVDDSVWRRVLPDRLLDWLGDPAARASPGWTLAALLPVALVALLVGLAQVHRSLDPRADSWRWIQRLEARLAPLRSLNPYGLFRVMTRERPEILIEGSDDGADWRPYVLRHKAGPLARRPPWAAPHQPRLDWQMWFAALGSYRTTPWVESLLARLLEGSPQVLALLAQNPFPERPPRYARATLWSYRFTTRAERRASGEWWRREYLGPYSPVLSLEGGSSAPESAAAIDSR